MIEEGYDEFEKERVNREDRKRAIGGVRKFKLVLRERFLMPADTKPSDTKPSKILRIFEAPKSKILKAQKEYKKD